MKTYDLDQCLYCHKLMVLKRPIKTIFQEFCSTECHIKWERDREILQKLQSRKEENNLINQEKVYVLTVENVRHIRICMFVRNVMKISLTN